MIHPVTDKFTLKPEHREFLYRCALSDEIIDGRPYYSLSVDPRIHLSERWNFSHDALRGDGIVIPRYSIDGSETYPQIRYTPPQNDQKYTCPVGSGGVIDAHPSASERVRDGGEPLIFAESIKGADALLSAGILAAGFHGVWGWKVAGGPTSELGKIPLAGRDVGILFDADALVRPDLRKAIKEFSGMLVFLGAAVTVLEIPPSVGEKAGIDDYLAALSAVEAG